ncbi:MAG: hypothetical protein GX221_06420 [Candidatus Riflebacteria bacterium]|nr:hypothetical protein [Candidatus Riflebacteria bacterium]
MQFKRQTLILTALSFLISVTLYAEPPVKKKLSVYETQTLQISDHIQSGKHRSAEKYTREQSAAKPSEKLAKDLARFDKGDKQVNETLATIDEAKLTRSQTIELLRQRDNDSYFAKKAPEVSLRFLKSIDFDGSGYNSMVTSWCGLERVVNHSRSPQIREKKYKEFLTRFKEASPAEVYKAAMQLRYIYLLEFNDKEKADLVLSELESIEAFKPLVSIERSIEQINSFNFIERGSNDAFLKMLSNSEFFPYDNEVLPLITIDHLNFMVAINDMVAGRSRKNIVLNQNAWRGLPANMLYYMATNQKMKAYEIYKSSESSFSAPEQKMLEQLMFPLYKNMTEKERLFCAGLVAADLFPEVGTSLMLNSITGDKKVRRPEHVLAVISEVYADHNAAAEAKAVWETLASFYPESIWLK